MSISNLPRELYITKTGRNYEHPGRSTFGAAKGPYQFSNGKVTVINHPQDVLYFVQNREDFKQMGMSFYANSIPDKLSDYTIDDSLLYGNADLMELYAIFNEKFKASLDANDEADTVEKVGTDEPVDDPESEKVVDTEPEQEEVTADDDIELGVED